MILSRSSGVIVFGLVRGSFGVGGVRLGFLFVIGVTLVLCCGVCQPPTIQMCGMVQLRVSS